MELLRNSGPSQLLIKAADDKQAVQGWLNEYSHTPNTYQAYSKEVTRLLLFLELYRLNLKSFTRADIDTFTAFLRNPPAELIGPPKPRANPEWKPFAAPLSDSSVKYTMRTMRTLIEYLQNAGYVERNPFKLLKGQRHVDTTMHDRYLDAEAWQTVKKALQAMPAETFMERAKKIRARWVVSFLYLTGARRSEAAATAMSDFRRVDGRWWWYVDGKGGKRAQVPASDELLSELMLYRRHLGLYTLPQEDEPYPAIVGLPAADGSFRPQFLNDRRISVIVKEVFTAAAGLATSLGQRNLLLNATTHWLRHTSATHQIDMGLSVPHVSAIMRHSKIDTTMRYVHQDRRELHQRQQSFRLDIGEPNEDVPSVSDSVDGQTGREGQ